VAKALKRKPNGRYDTHFYGYEDGWIKTADLMPALGYPGGPCHVIHRIEEEVHNPRLREHLIDEVEDGDSLSNPEAAKVYHIERERGAGIFRQILIGPHTQYRMDLRGITVPQIRAALAEFTKLLNDWKSRKDPRWVRYTTDLAQGTPVEYLDRHGLFVAFSSAGPGTIKLITTYYKGERDPKVPSSGCRYSYDRRSLV
jgi:hypothetical protein